MNKLATLLAIGSLIAAVVTYQVVTRMAPPSEAAVRIQP